MRDRDTCPPARYGEFNSILLVPQADGEIVVVSMGTEGVLVRNPRVTGIDAVLVTSSQHRSASCLDHSSCWLSTHRWLSSP